MTEHVVPAEISGVPEARLGDIPPERRNGYARSLIPTTWIGRAVRLEYSGVYGPVETTGSLLDFCGFGPICCLADVRTIIAWDRLSIIELVDD